MDAAVAARLGGTPIPIRHGRWTAEVRGDEVAEITFDGVPLLRAVRPVVRDRGWNTVPVRVVEQVPEGAGLITELSFEAAEIRYRGTIRLVVTDHTLTVDFVGEARTAFARNRIGLVVLHRADDAGRAVHVRHSDGTTESGCWPTEISPHQPFRDVAGFAWTHGAFGARLDLDGDVFETEDQRNWTDASFKTYSTPLDLPFPVDVAPGDQVHQQVGLTATALSEPVDKLSGTPAEGILTVHPAVIGTVPPISLGASLYPPPDPAVLASLSPAYDAVLVELTGDPGRWPELITAASAQAKALDAPLDVRLVTADSVVVDATAARLADLRVARLAAYEPETHRTSRELWSALIAGVRRHGLDVDLVGGTRAHFTELNRQQTDLRDLPALTFSLTPQMHATEVPHLVDSLATQRTVIDNACRIAADRPLHVGPVTLRPRFNAVATGRRSDPTIEAELATDPLRGTDFAAAWTVGSVAALSRPGVASLGYFETVGSRGVLDPTGRLTPAGQVLDLVARWRGRPMLAVTCPPGTAVLATRSLTDDVELLIANLTPDDRTLTMMLPGAGAEWVRLPPWSVTARLA